MKSQAALCIVSIVVSSQEVTRLLKSKATPLVSLNVGEKLETWFVHLIFNLALQPSENVLPGLECLGNRCCGEKNIVMR